MKTHQATAERFQQLTRALRNWEACAFNWLCRVCKANTLEAETAIKEKLTAYTAQTWETVEGVQDGSEEQRKACVFLEMELDAYRSPALREVLVYMVK